MATRKTGGKKAGAAARKKAAPRRGPRRASAKTAPETAVLVDTPEPTAGRAAAPSVAAPQGALVDVARTIGSTLGAIASTTRSALHKNKRPKKNS